MTIKTNFKDYYDFALSGLSIPDNTITYPRILSIQKIKIPSLLLYSLTKQNINFYQFFLIIGEKFYKGIQEVKVESSSSLYPKPEFIKYHYDLTTLDEYSDYIDMFNKFNLFFYKNNHSDIHRILLYSKKNEPIIVLKAYTNVKESVPDRFTGWQKKFKEKDDLFKENNKNIVFSDFFIYDIKAVLNDSLKNVSFNQKLPAHLVYQEIEQYLLFNKDKQVDLHLSDIEKRNKHGFNNKSFKH